MSIMHAILGFLSWRPFSGYDLKKMFMDSLFFYWSGNNNQIYRTLVQLHQDGLVSLTVESRENGPNRKLYAITPRGLEVLRQWVPTEPELPQLRNSFLIQLAWADLLPAAELDKLIISYETTVSNQLLMCREQQRRKTIDPARTPRETLLWEMISQNWIDAYRSELTWIQKLRQRLTTWVGQ
jgi:PadR family transcriptional regulator, regulatory protein AphA